MSKEINKEQTNTLLSCPFCGGEARLHKTAFLKYEVEVVCKKCGSRTLTHSSASFSDANMNAIKAWNTRKPMQNIVERLEALTEKAMSNSEKAAELGQAYEKHMIFNGARGNAFEEAIEIVKEEGGLNV